MKSILHQKFCRRFLALRVGYLLGKGASRKNCQKWGLLWIEQLRSQYHLPPAKPRKVKFAFKKSQVSLPESIKLLLFLSIEIPRTRKRLLHVYGLCLIGRQMGFDGGRKPLQKGVKGKKREKVDSRCMSTHTSFSPLSLLFGIG